MSEFLSSLPVIRDSLLLIINLASLFVLFTIAGLLGGQRRRAKSQTPQFTEKLEQLVAAQKKLTSTTVATGNEFRHGLEDLLKAMSNGKSPSNAGSAPMGEFKAMRAELRELDKRFSEVTQTLKDITEDNRAQLEQLVDSFRTENFERIQATEALRRSIQDDLKQQTNRLRDLSDSFTEPPQTNERNQAPTDRLETDGEWFEQTSEWQEKMRLEVNRVTERLDQIQKRMEEIFQF